MTDLKMTLASVAIEHAVINPLGRSAGPRRRAYDCLCGEVIIEDHTDLPVIHRDIAYNLHLLLTAVKAIRPTKTAEEIPA